jgi:exopolyphosphatase/guanosine-5'-triphosphate,3'-diphosphate pyrophosphatase
MQRRAVIDIGTNSVKLLVADVDGPAISPVHEESEQTRLGAGFYETHQLQEDAIRRTAAAVKSFSEKAVSLGAAPPRVVATSAARDAKNVGHLLNAVFDSSHLLVEILSGSREADWAFRGVTSDPKLAHCPALIVDVGGGSSEFIVGENAIPQFRNSYSLGSVRLLEQLRLADPPGRDALDRCRKFLRQFLAAQVASVLSPALQTCQHKARLIGVGGTATILVRMEAGLTDYNREKIEATPVRLERIRHHLEQQWAMPLVERQKIIGLPPNRADVILTGMAIYEAIMAQFGFTQMEVSARGLRFWALLH